MGELKEAWESSDGYFFDDLDEATDYQEKINKGEFKQDQINYLANNDIFNIIDSYNIEFNHNGLREELATYIIDHYDKKQ